MTFETRLREWMAEHPMKAPSEGERAVFTAQVMARVRAEAAPTVRAAVRLRARRLWPQWSFALAAVAAGVLVGVVSMRTTVVRRASRDIMRQAETLAALGESVLVPDELDEWATDPRLVVAEDTSAADDASWVEQMSKTLEQLDDDAPAAPSSDSKESDWQQDLDMLDDAEFSATS